MTHRRLVRLFTHARDCLHAVGAVGDRRVLDRLDGLRRSQTLRYSERGISGLGILAVCLAGAIGVLVAWEILSLPPRRSGSVSLAFVGFTNDATGGKAAQFELACGFARDIGFSAGPVELRGSKGWPEGSNHTWYVLTHLGPAYNVGPGRKQSFLVSLSNVDGATWRAPMVYAELGSRLDLWVDRVRAALGKPLVCVALMTNTPDMVGVSTQTVRVTDAGRAPN